MTRLPTLSSGQRPIFARSPRTNGSRGAAEWKLFAPRRIGDKKGHLVDLRAASGLAAGIVLRMEDLPFRPIMDSNRQKPDTRGGPSIGIDAGGTLYKIVIVGARERAQHVIPTDRTDELWTLVEHRSPSAIGLTGGGAAAVARKLERYEIREVDEFEALWMDVRQLATEEGIEFPPRFLFATVGTGTSILLSEQSRVQHQTGSTLGGGTFLGLARCMGLPEDPRELLELARRGNSEAVDLTVGEIYACPSRSPLPGQTKASSFGKISTHHSAASFSPADLAAALTEMIASTLGQLCSFLVRPEQLDTVVIVGGLVHDNLPVQRAFTRSLGQEIAAVRILSRGWFGGALGATISLENPHSFGGPDVG